MHSCGLLSCEQNHQSQNHFHFSFFFCLNFFLNLNAVNKSQIKNNKTTKHLTKHWKYVEHMLHATYPIRSMPSSTLQNFLISHVFYFSWVFLFFLVSFHSMCERSLESHTKNNNNNTIITKKMRKRKNCWKLTMKSHFMLHVCQIPMYVCTILKMFYRWLSSQSFIKA